METAIDSTPICTPPKIISRNEHGLVVGVNYKFKPDNTVDWKAMIPIEYLYVNPDPKKREKIEKKYGKDYDKINPIEDKVEDEDLVIMLNGIKYLLRLRGFQSISYPRVESNESYAFVSCVIDFIPNYETESRQVLYTENACAHLGNTIDFGQRYLVEMATNRAFCRCVRNFLGIEIFSKEELSGKDEEITPRAAPKKNITILKELMEVKKLKFEQIKKRLQDENRYNAAWKTEDDLPLDIVFDLIERLKKYNP